MRLISTIRYNNKFNYISDSQLSCQDTSTGSPTSWNWNFGDGISSYEQNPVHLYTIDGDYNVILKVNFINPSYSEIKSRNIFVKTATSLNAEYSASPTSGKAPLNVTFTDKSTGFPTSWYWDFGDGTTSNTQNPVHTFYTAGNYTVNLTISNENNTDSRTQKISVLATTINSKVLPIANFTAYPTSGNAPLSVQFIDLSQNAVSRSWDYNNDGIMDSNDSNPVYIYTTPGTYTVNLTVSNPKGNDSKNATITVLEKSSSGGGSGGSSSSSGGSGGGGGGGSPEPQSNVEAKELSQAIVTSGKEAKFDFTKNATCVVYVSFDAKKTLGKTTTIAELLKGKSTLVPELPPGEVYKSFNVWVGNGGFATPINIENPVLSFKVEKSWLQSKNIDLASITLNRYNDKKWEQFPAITAGEDADYRYFTSDVSGYSSLAITGLAKGASEKSTENVSIVEPVQSANGTIIKGGNEKKTPGFEIVIGIVCLLWAFLCRRK